MDVDRALISKAVMGGRVVDLLASGVATEHFQTKTKDGQELADVLTWLTDFERLYSRSPSMQLFRERWPEFRMEPSTDSLESLIDAFFARVKRRFFAAKVDELARAESDPSKWSHLDEIMLDAARDLAALVPTGKIHRLSDMEKRVDRYEHELLNPESSKRFNLGIDPIDELSGGIRPGNVVVVAGSSGRGKSLLATWATMNFYEQGATGLFLPLEMTADETLERMDTMITHFSHKLLSQRKLADSQVEYWRRIARQFRGARNDIIVKDNLLGATTDRVYAEISRYKPDIAVVDFVQLMRTGQRYAAKWEALDTIANDLKQIAKATDCVVVMVSQDGRDSFENGSTESNTAGSVAIFQAADFYIGMHQTDEMYADGQMEVRFLKSRRSERMGGKHHSALLDWRPASMEFSYWDPKNPPKRSERFTKVAA